MREQTAATIHVGVYSSAVDSDSPPPPSIPASPSPAAYPRHRTLVQRLLPCRCAARRAPGCSGVVRLEAWHPAVSEVWFWFGFGARRGALSCRLQLAQRTMVRKVTRIALLFALIRPRWPGERNPSLTARVRPVARPPAPAVRRRAYVSATRRTERRPNCSTPVASTGPLRFMPEDGHGCCCYGVTACPRCSFLSMAARWQGTGRGVGESEGLALAGWQVKPRR
jgi:hypothetical protein